MTRHDQLLGALGALLPGAKFRIADCRSWHSITFSGKRLAIVAELKGDGALASRFAAALPDHEFALQSAVVADIAVVDFRDLKKDIRLKIDALLLDD